MKSRKHKEILTGWWAVFATNRIVYQVFWLFIFFFLLQGRVLFAQKGVISIDFQNEKIENILVDLAVQNGYEIVFNSSYFNEETVTIRENGQSLSAILKQILAGTNVDISIKGNTIILTKRRKVFGYIIDKETGETLISATIYDPESGIGTLTNESGYFHMEIPYENKYLVPSYVGYNSDTIPLRDNLSGPLTIPLESNATFSVIVVTKDIETKNIEQALGKKDLITNDIKTLYATGGEPDVFQYLYTQPGITTGPDGLGGVHVRGSDVSHNMFLFDGVKVYVPFHSLGLFSIFDINQLKHANFSKYGFHPKHGGRLASVLEMHVKEGDYNHWNSSLSFSTLATHFGLDGPIVKDKTSISFYARRTHLDPIIKNRSKEKKWETFDEGYSNHHFHDLNVKLQHRLGKNDRLSLTMYTGKDVYTDKTDYYYLDEYLEQSDTTRYNIDWQNQLAALKWNHLFNDKLFSNLKLSYSSHKYRSTYQYLLYDHEFGFEEFRQSIVFQFFSSISELGVDLDFDFFPNRDHHISFGGGYHHNIYRPGVGQDSVNILSRDGIDNPDLSYFDDRLDNSYSSNEAHIYVNDKWQINKKLHFNIGGRYSRFESRNILFDIWSGYNIFQANLSLHWAVLRNFSTTLSFDRTVQPVHLLSSSNIGFPNDLWIPSIRDVDDFEDVADVEPQKAYQINLGFDFRPVSGLSVSTDVYYKKMDDLYRFRELSALPTLFNFSTNFWEAEVTPGFGISKGFELEVLYQNDDFKGSLGYSFSKADRTFNDFNDDISFPYSFDQRHKFTLNLYQKLSDNVWFYANWAFFNGLKQTLYLNDGPFTPLENYFAPPDIRLSAINNYKLPDYHRLDLGIVWRKKVSRFQHELQIGVQNVYNRKNIFFSYYEEDFFFPEDGGIRESKSLPILPSLMYKIRFSGGG